MRSFANSLALAAAMILLPAALFSADVDTNTSKLKAPPPPFTDFRYEKPGTSHKIALNDLPQPHATKSAYNFPSLVARPENAWPSAPAGFKVELYAAGLDNPRTLRTSPNGDIFLAESDPGRIRVFRGLTAGGKPEQSLLAHELLCLHLKCFNGLQPSSTSAEAPSAGIRKKAGRKFAWSRSSRRGTSRF